MLSNKNRIQYAIQRAISEQKPEFSIMFSDVVFARVNNAAPDGHKGYQVYAAQCGDVTMLAWKKNENQWVIKTITW